MSFPLFDTLLTKTKAKDLSVAVKRQLVTNIEKIDSEGMELLFALVKAYEKHTHETTVDTPAFNYTTIPYKGISTDGTLVFDINNFPIPLRHIINNFVTMHLETMVEEDEINKRREDISSPAFQNIHKTTKKDKKQ